MRCLSAVHLNMKMPFVTKRLMLGEQGLTNTESQDKDLTSHVAVQQGPGTQGLGAELGF